MEARHLRAQAGFAWQHSGSAGSWTAQGMASWHFLSSQASQLWPGLGHSCHACPDLTAAGTLQPWRLSQGSSSSPTTQKVEARARVAC